MIHIDINKIKIKVAISATEEVEYTVFEMMSNQYAKDIQNFLTDECRTKRNNSKDKSSPGHIYHILKNEISSTNLISISLNEMDDIIKKIQEVPGWSWLGAINANSPIWQYCKKCKQKKSCNCSKAHDIHKKLFDFFNGLYDKWLSPSSVWGPYEFIKSLKIKACPYCNLEYAQIATFKRENGKKKNVHPALDHFYPKSKYPFFALSLNNLVPSCTTCNSSIKKDDGSIKSYKDIINPYDETINYYNCIKYTFLDIPKKSVNMLLAEYGEKLKDDTSELGISLKEGAKEILIEGIPWNEENDEYNRAKRMFDYFAIKPRLEQGHNDYIKEITIKAMEYPNDYINHLKDKGYSVAESLRLYFGNYVESKDFNLRPLSKITHDIIKHLYPDILKELEGEDS